MNPKNVLLISPYFPPRRRVGAQRAYRFSKYLPQFGFKPHVVSLSYQNESLTESEATALSDIEILRLRTFFDRTGRKPGSQLNISSKTVKSEPSKFSDWVDRAFPVDTWLPILLLQVGSVREFCIKHDIHIIWSTGDPWSSHVLAYILSDSLKLPWVSDWRDPWTICKVRDVHKPGYVIAINRWVEKKIMQRSDRLVFTANTAAERYKVKYSLEVDRISTIYNSFDGDLPLITAAQHINNKKTELELLFFGVFRDLSPIKPVVDMLLNLKSEKPDILSGIKVTSFGSFSKEDISLLKMNGLSENFRIEEPLLKENAIQRLKKADLLLLSTDQKRDDIVPAKFWDYLQVGRPILSIAPNLEIDKLLNITRTGIQGLPKSDLISDILSKCYQAVVDGKKLPIPFNPALDKIKLYSASETTRQLASVFNKVLNG